jgi:tyrosinase
MATYTRANAWNSGGTFQNSDLLWYAKGVGEMQNRKLDDPHSWWFFAALHGQVVTPEVLKDPPAIPWKTIPSPPSVPTTPLPNPKLSDRYWDQCQHQSWYFLPWHRGYLTALEAHIRAIVISLKGPATWALPYWNYFGGENQKQIPPAFTEHTLPNGSPNPLYVKARYGPKGNGHVFVEIPPTAQKSLLDRVFAGRNNSVPPGFGGPVTGFSHENSDNGGVETNPHNNVHGFVGGPQEDALMGYPALAALDPIFYLHHANIDRLWAVWNNDPTHTNPTSPNWLKGPVAVGDREFVMPMPDGSEWVYTPVEMSDLAQQTYTYDDLPKSPQLAAAFADRLKRLGAKADSAKITKGGPVTTEEHSELVGASEPALVIQPKGASTSVKLESNVRRKVAASLAAAAETSAPDRVFLKLENVRGTFDPAVLSVYVNLPSGAAPAGHPDLLAGTVGLFGLKGASRVDAKHGGKGLSFSLEITDIVDALHLKGALDVDSLHVDIEPQTELPAGTQITVGRISIYRLGR